MYVEPRPGNTLIVRLYSKLMVSLSITTESRYSMKARITRITSVIVVRRDVNLRSFGLAGEEWESEWEWEVIVEECISSCVSLCSSFTSWIVLLEWSLLSLLWELWELWE